MGAQVLVNAPVAAPSAQDATAAAARAGKKKDTATVGKTEGQTDRCRFNPSDNSSRCSNSIECVLSMGSGFR